MSLDPDRLRQIDRVFDQALDLEGVERAAFLDDSCGVDEDLRARVERLLTAAEKPKMQPGGALLGSFGDELLLHLDDSHHRKPGSHVGPYRLLREVGTGGAAAVFLAHRDDDAFAEEVVIKLFKAEPVSVVSDWMSTRPQISMEDLDTLVEGAPPVDLLSQTQGRDAERTPGADALLDPVEVDGKPLEFSHPGLADLRDAGYLEDGRVYVVMDYVEGSRIDEYCDRRTLGLDERLKLFLQACSALQHAHSHLVVHGDLKLSSMLVEPAGRVRILDVGLSELLGSSAPRILGRPAAGENGVWPDVQRLGEVLFGLLTGCRIHDDERVAGQLPSESVGFGEEVVHTARARARGLTPRTLRHKLQGDLDAIILRALSSGPASGYATVECLAGDIRSYLSGGVVEAAELTGAAVVTRQLKRRALPLLAAATVPFLLGAGAAWMLPRWLGSHAQLSTSAAPASLDAFLERLLRDADISRSGGTALSVRDLLDRGVQQIERGALSGAEASDEYAAIAAGYRHFGVMDRALTVQAAAIEAVRNAPLEEARLTIRLVERAEMEVEAGLPSALSTAETAVERATGLGEPEIVAAARAALGRALVGLDAARARSELEASLPVLPEEERFAARLALATALRYLAEPGLAEETLQEAVVSARQRPGVELGTALAELGRHRLMMGRPSEASESLQQSFAELSAVLGDRHWRVAETLSALARSRYLEGRFEDALEASRQALSVARQVFGDRHPVTEAARSDFAIRLFDLGDLERSESLLLSSAAALEEQLEGGVDRHAVLVWQRLALVRHAKARFDQAMAAAERATALQRPQGADQAAHAVNRILLARSALAASPGDEAAEASLQVVLSEGTAGPLWLGLARTALASSRLRRDGLEPDESEETVAMLQASIDGFDLSPGRGSWQAAEARAELAALWLERGDTDAARQLLDACEPVVSGRGDLLEKRVLALRRRAER